MTLYRTMYEVWRDLKFPLCAGSELPCLHRHYLSLAFTTNQGFLNKCLGNERQHLFLSGCWRLAAAECDGIQTVTLYKLLCWNVNNDSIQLFSRPQEDKVTSSWSESTKSNSEQKYLLMFEYYQGKYFRCWTSTDKRKQTETCKASKYWTKLVNTS